MNIFFRVDCSYIIGGGHIKRCLSLAKEFKINGIKSTFICQDLAGLDTSLFDEEEYSYYIIPATKNLLKDAINSKKVIDKINLKVDLLIIDNYNINFIWENLLKDSADKLVVIDDLINNKHECDLIINQVYGTKKKDYDNYILKPCIFLLGNKYMMIRKEFLEERKEIVYYSDMKKIKDVHISFGLNDKDALTIKFSKLILEYFPQLRLHISIGNKFMFINELKLLSKLNKKRIVFTMNTKNVAAQMSKCQIAIGSPGMLTWERAFLGLPSLQLGTSKNQVEIMEKLDYYGICKWLGLAETIQDSEFIDKFKSFLHDSELLEEMRNNCLGIIDGKGIQRICSKLIEL
tara:strand:+ start:2057 stop:3097 length:1041 start_codon:yes stop_codon:yes gene_type:complete